jgi:hypothetical protein
VTSACDDQLWARLPSSARPFALEKSRQGTLVGRSLAVVRPAPQAVRSPRPEGRSSRLCLPVFCHPALGAAYTASHGRSHHQRAGGPSPCAEPSHVACGRSLRTRRQGFSAESAGDSHHLAPGPLCRRPRSRGSSPPRAKHVWVSPRTVRGQRQTQAALPRTHPGSPADLARPVVGLSCPTPVCPQARTCADNSRS